MKKVKFKDVADGQEFGCSEEELKDKHLRRIKIPLTYTFNNRWADGCVSPASDIVPDQEVYIDEPELAELDNGLYAMYKKGTTLWLYGLYDGIEGDRYRFVQAKGSGSFTIDPDKWVICLFRMNNSQGEEK